MRERPVRQRTELDDLFDRARAGDKAAEKELFEKYGHHMLRVVRRRLKERMRQLFDSDDFTQEAWLSFYQSALHLKQFDSPNAFMVFMTKLAENRVIDAERRHLGTAKRDMRRTVPLDEAAATEL